MNDRFRGTFGVPRPQSEDDAPPLVDSVLYRGIASANGLKPPPREEHSNEFYENAQYLTGKGTIEYRDGREYHGSFAAGQPTEGESNGMDIPNGRGVRNR